MHVQKLQYDPSNGWNAAFDIADSEQTLVLVFGASRYLADPAAIAELRQRFPRAAFAGCSTSGEVFADTVRDDTLAVAITRFDKTTLRQATCTIDDAERSREVGAALGEQLRVDDLRGVLLLSDGLGVNGTDLARGLTAALGDGVIVTGGLAGDGSRFERTWVFGGDGAPTAGAITAVGFYGDSVRIGHGSRGGWDTFGPERKVTRSSSNVLFELDGRPALELYKEYLGARAEGLPATALLFPLSIRDPQGADKQLVRTVLAVDEDEQSMTFAGDIPQGWHAQLMTASFDRLIDGAADAAEMARRDDENALTTLAIAVSCVGRRLVLGERAEEELEATRDALPAATELVGFYSYGELSPSADGSCDLHNQTMTLTTIQED